MNYRLPKRGGIRKILDVSDAFFGGANDKRITAKDSFPVGVAAGQYKNQASFFL